MVIDKIVLYRVINSGEYAQIKHAMLSGKESFALIYDRPFCMFAETAQFLIDMKKDELSRETYYIMEYSASVADIFAPEKESYENGAQMMSWIKDPLPAIPLPVYNLGTTISLNKINNIAPDLKFKPEWLKTKQYEEYFDNLTYFEILGKNKKMKNAEWIKRGPYSVLDYNGEDIHKPLGLYKDICRYYRYRKEDLMLNVRAEREIAEMNRDFKRKLEARRQARAQMPEAEIIILPFSDKSKDEKFEKGHRAESILFLGPKN